MIYRNIEINKVNDRENGENKGSVSCAKIIHEQVESSEKAMAPYCSTLAWKTPWMEEPGRLQSMGLLMVGHD